MHGVSHIKINIKEFVSKFKLPPFYTFTQATFFTRSREVQFHVTVAVAAGMYGAWHSHGRKMVGTVG